MMKNTVQLITYVDRFGGGTLSDLSDLLKGPLQGVFGGVHLLPFFDPIDGADAGFDPIDHTRVDPRLGVWADVAELGKDLHIMADVIVNHVSAQAPQFLDWARHGEASPHEGLFLTLDHVFPGGATEADLLALYRPRPGLPFTAVTLAGGQRRLAWTTFTSNQLDIDVEHPSGRRYLLGILDTLAASRVGMVRMDAVGYAIKRAGTSCFMLPQTYEFIDTFAAEARSRGIEVLVEIHAYYATQLEIARRVDWVYDFALPPLALYALHFGDGSALRRWLGVRPANAVTVLDTHDGIGIVDVGADPADRLGRPGLLDDEQLDALVERIHVASGGGSRLATGAAASNLDLYQVNCSFYDALGGDDEAYLIARAVQLFLPGIPQIYYMGLLAGRNDMALLAATGVGRDINRRRYRREEIESELERPVVQRLIELIRLRNTHDAFQGEFAVLPGTSEVLTLCWKHGAEEALLAIDFGIQQAEIHLRGAQGRHRIRLGPGVRDDAVSLEATPPLGLPVQAT